MNASSKTPVTYTMCVCEYAYNGKHGAPAWYEFKGDKAKTRALQFVEHERQRSSVTSVTLVRMNARQNFSSGVLIAQYRNRDAKPPVAA
jgi:hypothetical protein